MGKVKKKRNKDAWDFYEFKKEPKWKLKSLKEYRIIREYVKSKSTLNTSETVFEEILIYYPLNEILDGYTLNNFIIELLDKAIAITKEDNRKTVRGRDIFLAKEEIKNIAKEEIKKANEEIKNIKKERLKKARIERETHMIKRTVLDLGMKFARLQIAEISEVCGEKDEQLIIIVVEEMITNNEIYAQYFSSTKSVAFNQQANIDEIDKLMATYEDWEDKKVSKK